MIRGTAAVAGLSWREAWRGRLWLVPLAAMVLLAVLAPRINAAESGGAVRLLAAGATAAAAFCAILLAALVPASQLTRDLETRISLTVLPKPLPRLGWILGRWWGAVLIAGAASVAVAMAGSGAVAWRSGGVPEARTLGPSQTFNRVTGLGEAVAVPQGVATLAGPAGDGARWTFSGLDAEHPERYEVLLRMRARGGLAGSGEATPARVVALAGGGSVLPLALDPASPYGRAPANTASSGANCWIADRTPDRKSLAADWARLRLAPGSIARDGGLTIQLTRLDPGVSLEVSATSCAVAVPAGAQPLHAMRAALAELAAAAVVAAAALAVATISGLPVALLAGLTVAFAGNAMFAVRDTLAWGNPSHAVVRLLELAVVVFPDFDATSQGVRLAAGEAVSWGQVGMAWVGVAPHIAVLLLLAWWSLARRQL